MLEIEIYNKLNYIFIDLFEDESIIINKNTTSKDIPDWDSLMHITLIANIEDEFNIKFNIKDMERMENVGSIVSLIQEKL